MSLHNQLIRATDIAIEVHTGQYDKNNQPYINHVIRVSSAGQTIQKKIVGALHDVVEDSNLTIDNLKEEGFDAEILDAVHTMTHYEKQTYDEYIYKIILNPLAARVKINDLTDNMDLRRLDVLDGETIMGVKKYFAAYKKIINSFIH